MVKNVTNPNQTRLLLTGLRMFAEYEIRVRAIGLKGPGPFSRSVVERTKEDGEYLSCMWYSFVLESSLELYLFLYQNYFFYVDVLNSISFSCNY